MPTPNETPVTNRCRRLVIPDNVHWLAAYNGQLAEMMHPYFWEQIDTGDLTPEQAAQIASKIFWQYKDDGDSFCMAGEIFAWYSWETPKNALLCDGSEYQHDDYPALGTVLGSSPGGTFGLPDFRGRFLVGEGTYGVSPGAVNLELGDEFANQPAVNLTVAQLPSHTHTTQPHSHVDAGHTHGYIPALPSIQVEAVGVPFPSAVPGATVTAPGFASIQPETVTVDPVGSGQNVRLIPRSTVIQWWIHTR